MAVGTERIVTVLNKMEHIVDLQSTFVTCIHHAVSIKYTSS